MYIELLIDTDTLYIELLMTTDVHRTINRFRKTLKLLIDTDRL